MRALVLTPLLLVASIGCSSAADHTVGANHDMAMPSPGEDASMPSGDGAMPGGDGGTNTQACAALPAPTGPIVDVTDTSSLMNAINNLKPDTTIRLAAGSYDLSNSQVNLNQAGVTLLGNGGNRANVILDANYPNGISQIISITASNVTVADMTIRRAFNHAIHVDSSNQAITGTMIYNVHIVDPGEQAIKINVDAAYTHGNDNGTIACSHLELTGAGRTKVDEISQTVAHIPCYTGGIDGHAARGWQVRDNLIEGFWCGNGLSEHGVHFWDGSRDTVVERNRIMNSARGVGFGLGNNPAGRTYNDQPCAAISAPQHVGGMIRNNFIWAGDTGLFSSASGFDSGIALEYVCGAQTFHNSVVSTMPPASSSIEWRFAGTTANIVNNLMSAALMPRDGAVAATSGNIEAAPLSLFVNAKSGDLHLASGATQAIDKGVAITGMLVSDDIDGDSRDTSKPDVGADEVP